MRMAGKLRYLWWMERSTRYLVDCAVTGSSCGTADDSKFALLDYFRNNIIFEAIKDLVKVGGKYEGYVSRDFVATATGIKRKDGRIFEAPDPNKYN